MFTISRFHTIIAEYTIIKDTIVLFHQNNVLSDEKYWDKPLEFNPNRFLDKHGQYSFSQNIDAFVPFSYGRRKCPGETISHIILLLVLVKFLQLTNLYIIKLDNDINPHLLETDLSTPILQCPQPYNIKIVKY